MIGKTIGHYRLTEQLGRGGMGEVYLAEDLSLGRKVALKFLANVFTGDPERMARFEREAKLLASLNHPNIAAIYGLEQADGKRFLILEYVEGETLQQKLIKGPLPVDDALAVCRQIAEGLEAAHESGVIHRDLKPANVMITAEDKVKILDFGLAKALADEIRSIDSSHSPTITEGMTQPGVILGTAAYMSPEQAKGKSVDKRADIWAFGCILYECLTGKRVFEGETITETLASVIKEEPDLEKVPLKARLLLRQCLTKDPKKRLRDIGDAMAWMVSSPEAAAESMPVKRLWLWIAWSVTIVSLVAFTVLSLLYFREKPVALTKAIRFQIPLPHELNLAHGSPFALSPDGSRLAFIAVSSDGVKRLWIHALDSMEAQPLPGTESSHISSFFWSPDSRYIAFDAAGKLKKVDVIGGLTQPICDLSTLTLGGSWNRDGVIIFAAGPGLMRVSAIGGAPSPLIKPKPACNMCCSPAFLADGRHFLYFCTGTSENTGVFIGSLGSRSEEQESKPILVTSYIPVYIPANNSDLGQLLFLREQILMAQPFDEKRMRLLGKPVPVVQHVDSFAIWGFFSASSNDLLIYKSGSSSQFTQATWFDRQGKAIGTIGKSGIYYGLALSPDGTQLAVGLDTAPVTSASSLDVWLFNVLNSTHTRFTFLQGLNTTPAWSPDGSHIIFGSLGEDGITHLYQKLASGAKKEELLLKSEDHMLPTSWSSDGRFLLYTAVDPKTKGDLWVLPMEGDRQPILELQTEYDEIDGRFSPDIRWIAYVSDESGIPEIYVREFSRVSSATSTEEGAKWQISQGGGMGPRWRRDGRELYYRTPDGSVMAVEVADSPLFRRGTAKHLFQAPPAYSLYVYFPALITWDVTTDGKRFLLPAPMAESSPSPFTAIFNWTSLIEK